MRRWGVLLLAALVLVAGVAALVAAMSTSSDGDDAVARGDAPEAMVVDEAALRDHAPARGLLVRSIDERAPLGDGRLVSISASGAAKRIGDMACKRVHAVPDGPGLCLRLARNGMDYEAIVLDQSYSIARAFPIDGIPDRARVSKDGRYGAYTAFDARGATGYFAGTADFTTYTRIVDMATGRTLQRLEDLLVIHSGSGRRLDTSSSNFWGVTFAGGRRFYATVAVADVHYLIEGKIGSRRARTVRRRVECPALSPDGRRIAYKRRIGDSNRWRFHVLDLETGVDVALAERRSIDDQPEWLDIDTIVYSDDRHVFAVPADGGGRPARLVANATSPAPLSADGGGRQRPLVDDRGPGAKTAPNEPLPGGEYADPLVDGNQAVQAEEALRDYQESLATGSASGACGELSAAARRRLGRAAGGCLKAVTAAAERRRADGRRYRPSKILAVALRGFRGARATVQDGDRTPFEVRLRLLDSFRWVLEDADLGDPTGLRPAPR